MKLSHSSKEKYNQCSEKWRLYYQEKLRTTLLSSPLFFGKAFDDATMRLLLTKKPEKNDEECKMMDKTAWEIFKEEFTHVEHLGKTVYLPDYENCRYFASDFEFDLLKTEDFTQIYEKADQLEFEINETNQVNEFMVECKQILRSKKFLDISEQKLYNFICWHSMLRKAEMMLDAFQVELMPTIHEVYTIQEAVSLQDGEDELIGFIDFVASFVDAPSKKYVVDLKTSSRAYPSDAVETSEQLATYAEYKNITDCAYVVVEKKIRKRQPRVRITTLRGKVSEDLLNKTFDNLTEVFYNIKEGNFSKVYETEGDKACFGFGSACEYYNYCRTKELKGLVSQKKED